MNINYIHRFYEALNNDNLSFIYQGDFNDAITEKIINLSEYNIEHVNEFAKMKNKVSFMIVECFQNIVRHGNETHQKNPDSGFPGLFLTRNTENVFYIGSANLIENSNIGTLKSTLDKINGLDKEQMKAFYLEVLSNEEISGKGGAGLGLIEMARKSGQPLDFDFEKFNNDLSFFYLMIKMQGKETAEHPDRKLITLPEGIEMHKRMREENILMIYKGDFAHSTIMPVLNMIEENLNKQGEQLTTRKKVYLVLVEALQNVCRHSKENSGTRNAVFMIGKNGGRYIVNTGNFIEDKYVGPLKERLTKIVSSTKEELNTLYKKQLKEGKFSETGAGLGLIDMARESGYKLVFDFKPVDTDTNFYSLSIQI